MKSVKQFVPALLVLALPFSTSAHQTAVFDIGGSEYRIVVGSLNEPIAVDDTTGVFISVSMAGHEGMAANDHHGEGGGITGLEESLQIELIAGTERKVLDLSPMYGVEGEYYSKFYPTVATTLQYRFFGTLNNTPVDLVFTCSAEAADEGVRVLSEGVTQKSRTGSYGCPMDKTVLGFPETSASIAEVAGTAGTANSISIAALALGIAAFGLSLRRRF